MINMKATTGGCGYVSASWAVINNVPYDAMCSIARFNVTLSSVDVSMTMITTVLSYNFTGLPYDTLFNVIVIGISINGKNVVSLAVTSVKTMIIESMCAYVYILYVNVHIHTYIRIMSVHAHTYTHTHTHTHTLLSFQVFSHYQTLDLVDNLFIIANNCIIVKF